MPVVAGVCLDVDSGWRWRKARAHHKLAADGILAIMEAYFPVADAPVESYFAPLPTPSTFPSVIYNQPAIQPPTDA